MDPVNLNLNIRYNYATMKVRLRRQYVDNSRDRDQRWICRHHDYNRAWLISIRLHIAMTNPPTFHFSSFSFRSKLLRS